MFEIESFDIVYFFSIPIIVLLCLYKNYNYETDSKAKGRLYGNIIGILLFVCVASMPL